MTGVTVQNDSGRKRKPNLDVRALAGVLLSESDAVRENDGAVEIGATLKHLGFDYYEFDHDKYTEKVSAAVMHEKKQVFVNSSLSPQEKNFALAHEVGHIVLHPGQDKVDFFMLGQDEISMEEIEAQVFAYELVMPINSFRKAIKKYNNDIDAIAKLFSVSPKRVKKRIAFEDRLEAKIKPQAA